MRVSPRGAGSSLVVLPGVASLRGSFLVSPRCAGPSWCRLAALGSGLGHFGRMEGWKAEIFAGLWGRLMGDV